MLQKQPGPRHSLPGSDLSPPAAITPASPTAQGNFLHARTRRSTECVRETPPRASPNPNPMWALNLLPRLPRVAELTSPRQRRGRAVEVVGVGECERDVTSPHLIFFRPPLSPWNLAAYRASGSRPCHALYTSFYRRSSPPIRLPSFLSPPWASPWPAFPVKGDQDSERAGRGNLY